MLVLKRLETKWRLEEGKTVLLRLQEDWAVAGTIDLTVSAFTFLDFETAECCRLSCFGLLTDGDLLTGLEGPRGTTMGTLPLVCRSRLAIRLIF